MIKKRGTRSTITEEDVIEKNKTLIELAKIHEEYSISFQLIAKTLGMSNGGITGAISKAREGQKYTIAEKTLAPWVGIIQEIVPILNKYKVVKPIKEVDDDTSTNNN